MPVPGRGRGKEPDRVSQLSQSQDFNSLSTAPLPPHYAITLAKAGCEPTADEYDAANIKGSELISDVDVALPLVPLPRRRGLWGDNSLNDHLAADNNVKPGIWRTAGLSYPCSCNLFHWPRAYGFAEAPPIKLSHLEMHPEPHQIPMLGDDILPWSTAEFDEVDLDSAMLDLREFDTYWQRALPWRAIVKPVVKGKGKARADVNNAPNRQPPGWGSRVLPGPLQVEVPPAAPVVTSPTRPPPSSQLAAPAEAPPAPVDWVEDARDRRAWWRDTIDADDSYGQYEKVLPRDRYPTLHSTERQHTPSNIHPFIIPRNLQSLAHPFHPDISYYCAKARNRVHWIIPIHGPVIIPRLNDPVIEEGLRPWPSRAELSEVDGLGPPPMANERRPAVIRWTPDSLRAFVHQYFEPTYRNASRPYGALHMALSHAKPDPYIALDPNPPLAAHILPPPNPPLLPRPPPVRPEAGDHMRIYCDSSKALILRAWLHSWSLEDGDGPRRFPFHRARFTLVGPRGEALLVA